MKSRQRPPLNLSSLDPVEEHTEVPPAVEVEPAPSEDNRPMSERRRRRLAEEQSRRAEAEAARVSAPDVVMPTLSTPVQSAADSSVAPFEPTPVPAASRVRKTSASSEGRAYLIAGLASAAWVAGVVAWLTYEVSAGSAELEPLRLAVYALIALAPVGKIGRAHV